MVLIQSWSMTLNLYVTALVPTMRLCPLWGSLISYCILFLLRLPSTVQCTCTMCSNKTHKNSTALLDSSPTSYTHTCTHTQTHTHTNTNTQTQTQTQTHRHTDTHRHTHIHTPPPAALTQQSVGSKWKMSLHCRCPLDLMSTEFLCPLWCVVVHSLLTESYGFRRKQDAPNNSVTWENCSLQLEVLLFLPRSGSL